ncbi:MAG TPA: zinc-ribbon domain containing protein [Bacillota bacterium]|nr:zinc-ribbon domain containing protein [Bacillota bacterium]HOL09620.1 zinc-ribbon domain containing protein [Bacillota bacterium]HPO97615.1 zinc-ribbon domain containing protein [Bacillota bacterium]
MYQDKNKECKECGQEFVFTASEQEFFASKGFTNEPGRCPSCRAAKKANSGFGNRGRSNSGYGRSERQMYQATCSACGTTATVPFQPTGDKPVYCRDCFQSRRAY